MPERNVLALWNCVLPTMTKTFPLKPSFKHYHLRAATGPAYHILCKTSILKEYGTFFVAKSRRNIPAENVRKWNLVDGMQVVSVAWKSIKTALWNLASALQV